MKTLFLGAGELSPAVSLLKREEVVVIPTETVYGLAADACSDTACKKIFSIKHRPVKNPLIVHCADIGMAEAYMRKTSSREQETADRALKLLESFAPGPVTVICYASQYLSKLPCAGTSSVALRIPDHAVFTELLNLLGKPLAAPSANISGKPSPTNALMAWHAMAGKAAAIVDGGQCSIGLESTIVDCRNPQLHILRPGSIGAADIAGKLGWAVQDFSHHSRMPEMETVPGAMYRHYAPLARLHPLFLGSDEFHFPCSCKLSLQGKFRTIPNTDSLRTLLLSKLSHYRQEKSAAAEKEGSTASRGVEEEDAAVSRIGLICGPVEKALAADICSSLQDTAGAWDFFFFANWEELQHRLYAFFFDSDQLNVEDLFIFCPPEEVHSPLYNRILRAADM